jgi:predicted small metal-binding protein
MLVVPEPAKVAAKYRQGRGPTIDLIRAESGSGPEPRGGAVAKVIKCDCGYVARGGTDEELLADAHKHIEESHPDLAGRISRADLLAMAEEE